MLSVVVATQPKRDDKVIHRLRVPEYLMLAELPGWPRTELLQGVIYDMPSESRLHALAARAVYTVLRDAFPDDEVFFSGSVVAGQFSMPQPDVFVERRDPSRSDQYTNTEDLVLVVEISATTLSRDKGLKLEIYAEAEVPEYWVVVPRGATSYLLRHTNPDPDKRSYGTVERIELPGGVEAIDIASVRGL
jgi:Uma2 family endonuclease